MKLMTKSWTGKKAETSPAKKEQLSKEKLQQAVLHMLEDREWENERTEYSMYRMDKGKG